MTQCQYLPFRQQILQLDNIDWMSRSYKIIDHNSNFDYHSLYLEQRKLKEEFQKRAQLAQMKNKKYIQTVHKKCLRCSSRNYFPNKQDQINELKEFKYSIDNRKFKPSESQQQGNFNLIQNFAIFGTPESLLADPEELYENSQGQLIYVSDYPTDIALHSAKLAFPNGNKHKTYSGSKARQKAIQIMSSNCSLIKTFIMNFEPGEQAVIENQLLGTLNPDNRIYGICLKIQDFTVIPQTKEKVFETEKCIKKESLENSSKALSCEETDISFQNDTFCNIVTTERVYCIFTKYPFFSFYEQFLKSLVNLAKTQRLVVYRESGCMIEEADSHFYLSRIKETFKDMERQMKGWELRMNKAFQLKLLTYQKLSLQLSEESCKNNFIQSWGLPIFQLFTVDKFMQVFTLIMLEQKVVFICENQYILTYTVHLFTRILAKPFAYPYPSVYLLPSEEQYLNAPFPVVYGLFISKYQLESQKVHQKYKNVYISLGREGIEIISHENKKETLKKASPILKERLNSKFKSIGDFGKRVSNLTVEDDNCIGILKDKNGFTLGIINQIHSYLMNTFVKNIPDNNEIQEMRKQVRKKKEPFDETQELFNEYYKRYKNKVKDPFYSAFLKTQLFNIYFHDI